MRKAVKLDIGRGNNKIKDIIGVDIIRTKYVDVIANVEIGLPFRDEVYFVLEKV